MSVQKVLLSSHEILSNLTSELQNKRVAVITTSLNCWDTFVCAQKIIAYLHRELGLRLENIALSTTDYNSSSNLTFPQGLTILNHTLQELLQWKPDLQIIAPLEDEADVDIKTFLKDVPTLAIAESGFNKPNSHIETVYTAAFGFSEDSLGILLDPQGTPPEDPLKKLPQDLYHSITDNLKPGFKLYFGHAQKPTEAYQFISAVIEMNRTLEVKNDLCFFMMGNLELDTTFFVQFGVAHLITVDLYKQKTIHFKFSEGLTIKLINGRLSSYHVKILHEASEYETLATQNESFFDALSVRKFPAYEVLPTKHKLIFQFFNTLPIQAKSHMKFYCSTELNSTTLANFYITRRSDQRIADIVEDAMRQLHNNHNFRPKFNRALYSLLPAQPL